MFRHWPCEHRDLSAHSSTSEKSGQNRQPGSHSRGRSRGQDPRYIPAILQLTLAADSASRIREARSTNAEVGSMTVETLAIGAADLAVQALIHICRWSRVRAIYPALGDVLHLSHMDSSLPSPLQAALTGLLAPAFLAMETEIFPVHGDPACGLQPYRCAMHGGITCLSTGILPDEKEGGSTGRLYVLDPEGCRDGVHTFTHGAVDELKASLAVALVGARGVPALSPQALNSRVLTLIQICQAEGTAQGEAPALAVNWRRSSPRETITQPVCKVGLSCPPRPSCHGEMRAQTPCYWAVRSQSRPLHSPPS